MNWVKLRRSAGYLAGVGLLIGGIVILPVDGVAVVPVSADLRDPQSLLGNRSPGSRKGGALTNTKQRYAASAGEPAGSSDSGSSGKPALGDGADGGPVAVPAPVLGDLPAISQDAGGFGFLGGYGGSSGGFGGGGGGGIGGGGGGGGGGSGGGGGTGGGGTGTDGTGTGGTGTGGTGTGGTGTGGGGNSGGGGGGNIPVVTPVPEPQTWAMMILGMAAIGAAMRRRNAVPAAAGVAG